MEETSKLYVHDYHSRSADIQKNRKRKSTKQAEPCSHPIQLGGGGKEKSDNQSPSKRLRKALVEGKD